MYIFRIKTTDIGQVKVSNCMSPVITNKIFHNKIIVHKFIDSTLTLVSFLSVLSVFSVDICSS